MTEVLNMYIDALLIDRPGRSLHSLFSYDSTDPYVITVAIGADREGARVWSLSRDRVTEGLKTQVPAGIGDVEMWSTSSLFCVRLSSPYGTCVLGFDWNSVEAYIESTLCDVPAGCESDRMDIDAVIRELLG